MKIILGILSMILLVGCSSKKTDKELFDEAQKSLKQDKIPEAVMSFEEIVNDHKDSELAPEALSQLAGLYQNKLIKSISEKENLEKAIELFKKLHDDYPKSEYAASGLFMAGFIYANDLKNFEEAKKCYQQFLKEYPDDDLAASAQAELDNLGLSPEEILQKRMANEN
jgi:TolA-binding protein